jgi:hypothetical protein
MTIDAEVHPKASTSKGIPGKIIPAVSAILPSMAANVSLVTFTSFLILKDKLFFNFMLS